MPVAIPIDKAVEAMAAFLGWMALLFFIGWIAKRQVKRDMRLQKSGAAKKKK